MKKTHLYILSLLALLVSCYDDKGGNDFDTVLPDVIMEIPEEAYSAALGSQITITPLIETTIDENDLEFKWEVLGTELYNSQGRNFYSPLVNDEEQGKVLNYTCHLDSAVTALNTSYKCRLHAQQKSTGRDFYSTNTFTITISGITGLLVLHGDDNQCDVGVIEADEFTPEANSLPESPKATPALYSSANNGTKIEGKGKSIIHALQGDYYWGYSSVNYLYRIFAQTDKETVWMNSADLSYYGDWNSMFYLQDDRAVNSNKPKGFLICDDIWAAFDGDDVFMMQANQQPVFLFAEFTPETVCQDGNSFILAPFFEKVASKGVQYMAYSSSVNGKSQKGFVGISNSWLGNITPYTSLIDTKNDAVKFNPADMKADLIEMNTDDRQHVMAVLKGDTDNATYPNKFFAIDLYPNASSAGESGNQNVPQYIYDLSAQKDISYAIAFEFGATKNMCYYATPTDVYQYGVDGETLYAASKLDMTDGSALNISGEITMMKFLESPNVSTHYTEPILLVATYSGGSSALYALHIDTTTGKVVTAVKYDSSNVEGWNFGKIYDVNIKAI